jgi:hypothetical protein
MPYKPMAGSKTSIREIKPIINNWFGVIQIILKFRQKYHSPSK